jgi:ATP-binding cassette subfamily B protein/subfamily B ATP-binding cassette protein MsbA
MFTRSRDRLTRTILGHLHSMRGRLGLAALCMLGFALMEMIAPWPIKIVIDNVLLQKPLTTGLAPLGPLLAQGAVVALVVIAISIVVITLSKAAFAYFQMYLTSRIGHQLVFALRRELFQHLQSLSLSYHNRTHSGELLTRITGDTQKLNNTFTDLALTFGAHTLTVIGMFVVMFLLNWRLALIAAATIPLLVVTLHVVNRKIKRSATTQRRQEGRMATRISEVLSAAALVQTFGRERYEVTQFEEENVEMVEENIRALRLEKAAARANELITALGTGTIVLFGSLQALDNQITPGALLVFIAYVNHLYKPVRNIAKLSVRFNRAMVSANRLREILNIEPEIQDAPNAIEAPGLRFDIVFDKVSFAYDGGGPVLRDVSFAIPAGKRVALVGASGAGKSTIVNLILRLYDPTAGRVLIDGVDLRGYRRESLRRGVGVVRQDSILFGATVRENIAYGRPDASPEEIEQAARAAHAHDFIACLPAGYDEVVGEGGTTLSGGQRQRICLARALIKHPSLLIMDEPATAVDAESAVLIRDAVRQLQAGKTTLLITHAVESVRDADHILVLNKGRIVEQGTHDELVRLGGHYCEIFRLNEPRPAASLRLVNVHRSG